METTHAGENSAQRIHPDASDVALLRVGSQFFRHVADGEVDEGAHARRQEASSEIDDVNR